MTVFPFSRGSFLELYRELVCNLAIIQVTQVGMAGHYKGLSDDRVIQLIYSFTRSTAHHPDYLGKLAESVGGGNIGGVLDVVWLLKER